MLYWYIIASDFILEAKACINDHASVNVEIRLTGDHCSSKTYLAENLDFSQPEKSKGL
jgi:hypothetical protein